jgi:hypothetical protein
VPARTPAPPAVADALRAGQQVPLFAPGPGGVAAAAGTAERHDRRRLAAETALAALEGLDELDDD